VRANAYFAAVPFVRRFRRSQAAQNGRRQAGAKGEGAMNQRALAAELIGTFMLMSPVLGASFYSFAAPMGAAGILGVALSIGATVMALLFAIGHILGGHFNPPVTVGLVAGGRVTATARSAISSPSASAPWRPRASLP
jgi:hypothetical protein